MLQIQIILKRNVYLDVYFFLAQAALIELLHQLMLHFVMKNSCRPGE